MYIYIYTHLFFTYKTLPWTDGCSIDECPDSHVTTLRPQAVDGTFTEAVQQWKVPFGNGGFNGKIIYEWRVNRKIITNHPLIVMVPWFSLVRQSFNQETHSKSASSPYFWVMFQHVPAIFDYWRLLHLEVWTSSYLAWSKNGIIQLLVISPSLRVLVLAIIIIRNRYWNW